MASVFGHVAASTALGYAFFPKEVRPFTLAVAGFCAFAPDLDVLGFHFGIAYSSEWGHRGWTHSLAFALIFSTLIWGVFHLLQKNEIGNRIWAWWLLSTLSHPLLDMLTNGGRGCAIWWPFSTERLFFPFRPIQVSPLSVDDFFTPWGLGVLASEVIWIGFPALALVLLSRSIVRKTG